MLEYCAICGNDNITIDNDTKCITWIAFATFLILLIAKIINDKCFPASRSRSFVLKRTVVDLRHAVQDSSGFNANKLTTVILTGGGDCSNRINEDDPPRTTYHHRRTASTTDQLW